MSNRAISAFISSTSLDLQDYRQAVAKGCASAGYQPIGMEDFVAQPKEPITACLDEVEKADVFIGIYAWRYGFVPPQSDYSITELEYDHAVALQKPCFCFFIDQHYEWADAFIEGGKQAQRLVRFKAKIEQAAVRTFFTTPDDLKAKVVASLARWERDRPVPPLNPAEAVGVKISVGGSADGALIAGGNIHVNAVSPEVEKEVVAQRLTREIQQLEVRYANLLRDQQRGSFFTRLNMGIEALILLGIVALFCVGIMFSFSELLGMISVLGLGLVAVYTVVNITNNGRTLRKKLALLAIDIANKKRELDHHH